MLTIYSRTSVGRICCLYSNRILGLSRTIFPNRGVQWSVTRFTIATETKILKSLACFTRHVCWEAVWIARVCYAEVLKTICVYSLCIFRTDLLCPPGLPLETGGGYEISNVKQFIVLLIWCDRRFLVCNNLFVDFIRANEFLSQYQSWLKFQINFGDLSLCVLIFLPYLLTIRFKDTSDFWSNNCMNHIDLSLAFFTIYPKNPNISDGM